MICLQHFSMNLYKMQQDIKISFIEYKNFFILTLWSFSTHNAGCSDRGQLQGLQLPSAPRLSTCFGWSEQGEENYLLWLLGMNGGQCWPHIKTADKNWLHWLCHGYGEDTGADSTGFIYNIYTHVEGNPGFHRSKKRKVQEKWRFSHTHTPRFYTPNHSCPKQQVGHRSREKCLAQSSSDERICVLALNGKHNSSVMGDRCVKPTVSSAQSERRGKERAKQ